MIKRYSSVTMSEIWSDKAKFRNWLSVEYEVCLFWKKKGVIPNTEWKKLDSKIKKIFKKDLLSVERIEEIEGVTRHDVLAFTTHLAELIGPTSRYVHFGLTSSDVVDTAFALNLRKSADEVKKSATLLLEPLDKLSKKYRDLPAIGRTHGMYAEPTSFGLRFLGFFQEIKRCLERLDIATKSIAYGKLSGAVGSSPYFKPIEEGQILAKLGLRREPVSTQVIPRDRHAQLMFSIVCFGNAVERVSLELRNLQRSEVGEVSEGFKKGQKGSSAMPHKKNPISAENLCGCARILRGYCDSAVQNSALWHERDISHSSVERVIFPDAFHLVKYMLDRLTEVLINLEVNEAKIKENLLDAEKTIYSGKVLLELVKKGWTRERAYLKVQKAALEARLKNTSLFEFLKDDEEVKLDLDIVKLKNQLSSEKYLNNIKLIYKAVGKKK